MKRFVLLALQISMNTPQKALAHAFCCDNSGLCLQLGMEKKNAQPYTNDVWLLLCSQSSKYAGQVQIELPVYLLFLKCMIHRLHFSGDI